MNLRRLTVTGIEQFDHFRESTEKDMGQLKDIICGPAFSEVVDANVEVHPQQFPTRFAVGQYLYDLFDAKPLSGLVSDAGIWSWLAAYYFERLCPVGSSPGDRARWIPAVGDFRKYYRHLLAGPYQIYRTHRDSPQRAMALLANPPHRPGDIVEQLASRQELVTNKAVIEAATRLYIDPTTNRPKSGAASQGAGSARRLADVLGQLDLTWDLYALDVDQLINLLPDEFNKFIS